MDVKSWFRNRFRRRPHSTTVFSFVSTSCFIVEKHSFSWQQERKQRSGKLVVDVGGGGLEKTESENEVIDSDSAGENRSKINRFMANGITYRAPEFTVIA